MEDKNYKNLMRLIIGEDEIWFRLRGKKDEMKDLIEKSIINEETFDIVLDCMKACLSKTVIDEGKYSPFFCDYYELLSFLKLYSPKDFLIEDKREKIRNMIWGYMYNHIDLLTKMANEYMTGEEYKEIEMDERTKMLYMCVYVAYMEVFLREIEFSELEEEL